MLPPPPHPPTPHLVVELRGHSHEEVHIKVIVVCDEGLGRGTTRDHVHEGCLHLKETQAIKKPSHVRDDFGSVCGEGLENRMLVRRKI